MEKNCVVGFYTKTYNKWYVCKKGNFFKEIDLEKAIIHTYLAWQDEPGYPLGKAITAQSLRPETPIAREFTNWLTRLFVTDL